MSKVLGSQFLKPVFYVSVDMIPFRFPQEFQRFLWDKNVIVTKDDFIETRPITDPSYLTYDALKSVIRSCMLRITKDDLMQCARMTFITPCGQTILLKDRWPAIHCPDMQDKIQDIRRSDYLKRA